MPRHRSLAKKSFKVEGTGDGGKPGLALSRMLTLLRSREAPIMLEC